MTDAKPLPRATIELQPSGLFALLCGEPSAPLPVLIHRPEALPAILARTLAWRALEPDAVLSREHGECLTRHSGTRGVAGCRWCRQDGMGLPAPASPKAAERAGTASQPWVHRGDVMVRRFPPGVSGAQWAAQQAAASAPRDPRTQPKSPALQRQTVRSAEDLGL